MVRKTDWHCTVCDSNYHGERHCVNCCTGNHSTETCQN
ncbi:putative zinc ribbon protein [Yersinia pseudotuberculosis]